MFLISFLETLQEIESDNLPGLGGKEWILWIKSSAHVSAEGDKYLKKDLYTQFHHVAIMLKVKKKKKPR